MPVKSFQSVSIIIPIRNESLNIRDGLAALFIQDYPYEVVEILIADGMSTDDTRNIIHELASAHSWQRIRIFDNAGKIVSAGMNIALRQAKGEIIIRIDGHTVVAADYVRQCVDTLERTKADNVGGKMNPVSKNVFGNAVAFATSSFFGIGGGRFHYSEKEEWVDTVYMGAWPRRVFEKIGLFDEELIRDQDDEFNYRLRERGGRILLSPNIRSEYKVRSRPRTLWLQYYQYGFWKVRVLQKHPHQMSLRQFAPPSFVLALLISIILAFFPAFYMLSIIVPLLYLLINLCACLWIASRRSWSVLPYLPLVFAILHFSYGMGFWAGLFRFWNRWGDRNGITPQMPLDANERS